MAGRRQITGAVYVEFLIVIIPLLILMFSLMQMSLFLSAGILTRLAALKAARSAMVILGDDHEKADYMESRNQVGGDGSGIEAYRSAKDGEKKTRYQTIRKAARAPLIPVSPSIDSLGASSVEESLRIAGPLGILAALVDKDWTYYAVGLGFVNGKDEYVSSMRPGDGIRVRVVYLYPCFVPIGKSFACHAYGDLPSDDRALIEVSGKIAGWTAFLGVRFVTLRAEAAIPTWDR